MDSGTLIVVILMLAIAVVTVVYLVRGRSQEQQGATATAAPAVRGDEAARIAAEANAAPQATPFPVEPGFVVVGAPRSANFAGRPGEYVQIDHTVTSLIRDADPVHGSLSRSADPYPDEWREPLGVGLGLKRAGEFLASVETYVGVFRESGVVYSGAIAGLYKAVAASGALRAADRLLVLGQEIFEGDAKAMENLRQWGGQSAFQTHREELHRATSSAVALAQYLLGISGNSNYRMPRDYTDAVRELRSSV